MLTVQRLAKTPAIAMGTRSALKKWQGKLLRSSWAASARAAAFSAGGDGGGGLLVGTWAITAAADAKLGFAIWQSQNGKHQVPAIIDNQHVLGGQR